MNGDWQSKNIYLMHPEADYYVGLHAVGDYDENNQWHNMEAWENIYDLNKKFVCSNARLFGPIEETAEDMKVEGWKEIQDWEYKK